MGRLSPTTDHLDLTRLPWVPTRRQVLANVSATLAPARVRRATRNGRSYLVAPASLIVPGILAGSKGPLYYPPDEVFANSDSWQDIPLVVYHPTRNGRHISASSQGVYEESGVGFLEKPGNRNGKLGADAWFDVEHVRLVDDRLSAINPAFPRILPRLEAGKPIELSTGLFTENIIAPAGYLDHRGLPYVGMIARNYKPDHLAILPDQVGACSLNDGCGVLVNYSPGGSMSIRWTPAVNYDRSLEDKKTDLQTQLMDRFPPAGEGNGPTGPSPYLVDLYDDYVIYQTDEGLYRLGYDHDGEGGCVLVDDEPIKVRRVTAYEPVDNQLPSDELGMDPEKACQILKDGTVHGQELTESQRGMFGALCGEKTENLRWQTLVRPTTNQTPALTLTVNCGGAPCHCDKPSTNEANDLSWEPLAPGTI